MVLAAGIGKRMRPDRHASKAHGQGAGQAADRSCAGQAGQAGSTGWWSTHYLGDHLAAHLSHRKNPAIAISDERDALLETGGGMVRADRNGLLPDTFFALNSDNIWLDGPRDVFTELSDAWDDARMDALVLVVRHPGAHNYQGVGDFHLDPLGRVSRRRHGRVAPYIYTGIQLVSRRLLRDAPEGAFSTNLLWNRAIEEGRMFGVVHTGEWIEVGEPGHIAPAGPC
jgi:MurNAc alpha-1-phosphate uridylyltransferase